MIYSNSFVDIADNDLVVLNRYFKKVAPPPHFCQLISNPEPPGHCIVPFVSTHRVAGRTRAGGKAFAAEEEATRT